MIRSLDKGQIMDQTAIDSFSMTRKAADPRADGGTRLVHVNAQQVVIERSFQSVRMKVAVPVDTYRDLVISVRVQSRTASLRLRHEDQDLDVALACGDAIEVARKARAWGALLGCAIKLEEACVPMYGAFPRQRQRARPSRRSSFARRRKAGIGARLSTSFKGEREIIART